MRVLEIYNVCARSLFTETIPSIIIPWGGGWAAGLGSDIGQPPRAHGGKHSVHSEGKMGKVEGEGEEEIGKVARERNEEVGEGEGERGGKEGERMPYM